MVIESTTALFYCTCSWGEDLFSAKGQHRCTAMSGVSQSGMPIERVTVDPNGHHRIKNDTEANIEEGG